MRKFFVPLLVLTLFVGTTSATVIIRKGPDVIVPRSPEPDACLKKCARWYYFTVKPEPDACDYDEPAGARESCDRWYHAVAPDRPTPQGRVITLEGINFDFDKSTIRQDSIPILDANVADLKSVGNMHIKIVGHTDAIGTTRYNQGLSERRAQAVMNYLVGRGVSSGRMSFEGRGETQPVASNGTPAGRFKNRRIEIHIR